LSGIDIVVSVVFFSIIKRDPVPENDLDEGGWTLEADEDTASRTHSWPAEVTLLDNGEPKRPNQIGSPFFSTPEGTFAMG